MRHVIGIDPGTRCGWAVLDEEGEHVASGVWNLESKRHEGGGMRYVRARRSLLDLLDGYPGSLLAYEEVRRHRGTSAAHVYGGLVAMVGAVCEEGGVPYTAMPVATIKRIATSNGGASKAAVIAAAAKRWPGVDISDDNHADALWIAEALRLEVGS